MREAPRAEVATFRRVRRTSPPPPPPPSRLLDEPLHPELAWGTQGNTLQRTVPGGNSKTRSHGDISRRAANAPVRSKAPAGTGGKGSPRAPQRQTKSGPRRPPQPGCTVTPAGEEPAAGCPRGRGGSRGTYKSRVPPEAPGRVCGAAGSGGRSGRRGGGGSSNSNSNASKRGRGAHNR